ncbi:MAG: response regulator transcription factor [Acidobacteriaceae bacterium]
MPKVLIVDDNAQTLQTLTFLLTPAGYQCFAAKTPIEARSAFIMERPDLAILDHGLPGEDGATLASTLKRLGSIKILMLTGRATLEKPHAVDLLLYKPQEPRAILEAVAALLNPVQT